MSLPEIMGHLLDELTAELEAAGDTTLCALIIHPGADLIADYGGCGGTAWVRLSTAFPSDDFPQPVRSARNCASTLAYPVEMGIIRPAPLGEMRGNEWFPPTDSEQNNASFQQYADLELMHRALKNSQRHVDQFILGSYMPMGPQGDIYGGVWTATVGMDDE